MGGVGPVGVGVGVGAGRWLTGVPVTGSGIGVGIVYGGGTGGGGGGGGGESGGASELLPLFTRPAIRAVPTGLPRPVCVLYAFVLMARLVAPLLTPKSRGIL